MSVARERDALASQLGHHLDEVTAALHQYADPGADPTERSLAMAGDLGGLVLRLRTQRA